MYIRNYTTTKRNYVVVHLCQQGWAGAAGWHHFRLCHYLLAYLLKYIVILSYDVLHVNRNVAYIYRYSTIHAFRQHSQCTPIYHQCDLCDLELWYFVSKIIVTAEYLKCTEVDEIASVFFGQTRGPSDSDNEQIMHPTFCFFSCNVPLQCAR